MSAVPLNKSLKPLDYAALILLPLLVIVLLVLLPKEATLGNIIKLIYFHGAIARNGVIFFTLSGLAALAGLKYPALSDTAKKLQSVAFILWISHVFLSVLSMFFAWGPMWNEPRMLASLVMLFAAYLVWMLSDRIDTPAKSALVYSFVGLAVVLSTLLVKKVFHPANAVANSESLYLKVIFEFMSASVTLFCFEAVRLMREKDGEPEST